MTRGAFTLKWQRAVLEHPDLKTRARMIAAVLASHLNDGGEAWPAIPTVAVMAGYASLTPVRQGLDELVEAGFLTMRRGGGRGYTHLYKAVFPSTERAIVEYPFEDTNTDIRGDISPERVTSDAETGRSGHPNSSELLKNSSVDSHSKIEESRRLLNVPEGQSMGSFIITETRRRIAKVTDLPALSEDQKSA